MTLRSLLLGLLGGALIAAYGYFNDMYVGANRIIGNHFPISVFGFLIITVLLVNPALSFLHSRARLRPGELATIFGLILVACSVPCGGMRTFTTTLAMPAHFNRMIPGWRRHQVLSYAPNAMLPCDGEYRAEVLDDYLTGTAPGRTSLMDLPWQGWVTPLSVWVPILFLLGLCVICLALIVHRQWSQHERLRYPIAEFASSLMGQRKEEPGKGIFRGKLFWVAMGLVLAVRAVNGLQAWYPDSIEIPLTFDLTAVSNMNPSFWRMPGTERFLTPRVFPTVVAFSFFLAGDVALSLGLSQSFFIIVMAVLVHSGLEVRQDQVTGGGFAWQRFGSYLGAAILLLYVGRRHYREVMCSALWIGSRKRAARYAALAFRILLVSIAGTSGILIWLGLPWPMAVPLVLLILLMFVVQARINAESGLFFIQPLWMPSIVLYGLFGGVAMGPRALAIIGLVSVVLTIDPRESLMPFVTNFLRMGEKTGVSPHRAAGASVGAYVLALVVAIPAVLWARYNFGPHVRAGFDSVVVPRATFDAVSRQISELEHKGRLQESLDLGDWERVARMSPDRGFLTAAGLGLFVVAAVSIFRLRYTWWPLHPVLFLVWGTFAMRHFHLSFLLGWAIKWALSRLGLLRGETYRKIKHVMIGVIAGDLLGGLIFMVVSATQYLVTGLRPPSYLIFPS